jgi:serine kinase of HPr protein (carbohydrate metabolism regulator)
MICVYGTAVALGSDGVLLRGPSGSGKSDLALRVIDAGGRLVADDQTELHPRTGELRLRPPRALAGLLEVRGIGIVRMPFVEDVALRLVVDLVPHEVIERLPETRFVTLAGVSVPLVELAAFAASAVAKLRFAVQVVAASEPLEALVVS